MYSVKCAEPSLSLSLSLSRISARMENAQYVSLYAFLWKHGTYVETKEIIYIWGFSDHVDELMTQFSPTKRRELVSVIASFVCFFLPSSPSEVISSRKLKR